MLKTALKPQWILALLGALLVATGFVLLSGWQFDRSQEAAPPPPTTTENPVPLTEHFTPGTVMLATDADQVVSATGSFIPDSQVLVENRLQNGEEGYWVVAGFMVDGAPDDAAVAVVRGWQPTDAQPAPAPFGDLELTGRLLPTEAPLDQSTQGALGSLSVAQLINIWDVHAYSGFVVAFDVVDASGAPAGAETTGLEEVYVGPQPQERQVNWLNIFYGIEWVVFAGFAVFLWWRLVVDDYRRQQEDLADAAEEQALAEEAAAAEAEARVPVPESDGDPVPVQDASPAGPTTAPPDHTTTSHTTTSHTPSNHTRTNQIPSNKDTQ